VRTADGFQTRGEEANKTGKRVVVEERKERRWEEGK
jgi:hypothetical protein